MPGGSVTEEAPKPPPLPDELLTKSGFLMVRLAMNFKARVLAEVEGAGFSQYHYSVLAILDEQARKTQVTIADALAMDPSQLVGVLDGLERKGLVSRQRDQDDRRRHVVSLTAQGRKQLVRLRSMIDRLEDEMFAPLTATERATFHELLQRLASHHDPRWAPVGC